MREMRTLPLLAGPVALRPRLPNKIANDRKNTPTQTFVFIYTANAGGCVPHLVACPNLRKRYLEAPSSGRKGGMGASPAGPIRQAARRPVSDALSHINRGQGHNRGQSPAPRPIPATLPKQRRFRRRSMPDTKSSAVPAAFDRTLLRKTWIPKPRIVRRLRSRLETRHWTRGPLRPRQQRAGP